MSVAIPLNTPKKIIAVTLSNEQLAIVITGIPFSTPYPSY